MGELYHTETKAGTEKYPQWFKAVDGDTEGNKLLERGYALADAGFGGELKDATGKVVELTPQQRVKLHAAIRNKAGAFDRMVYLQKKDRARIKELETQLKDYEGSEPGAGERSRKLKSPTGDLYAQADAELMKRARPGPR